MHVLYVHRTAGDRVERVHIMGVVNALRQMGHTAEVAGPPGCSPERVADAAVGTPKAGGLRAGLKRFARKAPPVLFELAEIAYNIYSLLDLMRRRLRRKPDLVYERMTANSLAPALLARWWGVPLVEEVNVTTEIGRLRPLVLRRASRRIERWVVRRTTLFVTVSRAFKRMLVEQGGFPAERTIVQHNAVDPSDFDTDAVRPVQRPASFGPDAFVFGYVGAFVPYHRLDQLVEVAARMALDRPQVRWLLVGDGVDRPRVEALLDERGLRERFWLAGMQPHEAVPAHVMAMDAAVLPNSEAFNSPVKLFEYMAMGKAVVAPRVPAIAEVVEDGRTGLLFEPGDADSLGWALERLLDDAELREALGRDARREVLTNYTWSRNAREVLAAVEDALGGGAPGRAECVDTETETE